MGYLAILRNSATDSIELPRVHVNLWSLPSLIPSRRLFYFDLGVEIKAVNGPVTSIEVLLPFRVEEGRWPDGSVIVQDLYQHLTSDDTAELIFGGPVAHRSDGNEHFLSIGDYSSELKVVRIDPSSTKRVETYKIRPDSCLYEVALESALAEGDSAYIRTRWRVFGASPLWRWKRLSGGARMDLRLYDVRESQFAGIDRHLRSRLADIGEANIFLMTSPKLQLAARSPEFRYLRVLETRAWRTYLRGAAYRGNVGGLAVYYWRHRPSKDAPGKKINADNPFRVFLDFNRVALNTWWLDLARTTIAVSIAFFLIDFFQMPPTLSGFPDVSLWTIVKIVIGGSLLAWLSTIEKLRSWGAGRFLQPRLIMRRLERWLLLIGSRS